jgi:two-component system, OmpR family, sensor histidine kinase MprB
MSLRGRMGAAAALAVAGVVVAIALVVYFADRSELRGQVDSALREVAAPYVDEQHPGPGGGGQDPYDHGPYRQPRGQFGGASGYLQIVFPDGTVARPESESSPLPVDSRTLAVARGGGEAFFSEATVDGVHLRVLTAADADGGAVQVARPLTEVDRVLRRLRIVLLLVGLAGIAVAALIGQLVARAALAPVSRFTRRTEALTADPDLSARLDVQGRDELARLATSFNATLDALERSNESQRHLVADASHELRTPIASLRANIQMLGDAERLPPEEREALRADIIEELDALTALVADVVDLARGAQPREAADDVALDRVVEQALEVARRRAPRLRFEERLEPTLVRGTPDRIARAVANLLDNAAKWSGDGGLVEVSLSGDGVLTVRDHGPGFDEQDLPHVFDRFYRADEARRLPGSGLGLAIVRQTAEAHGGWARAANAEGGGARLEVWFGEPVATPVDR